MQPVTAYRLAITGWIGSSLAIMFLMGAVGIVGIEGDPMDLLYVGMVGIGVGGAAASRFQPAGMSRAMAAAAASTALLAALALLGDRHQAEYSSVLEILGLNAMFAAMFGSCAWLFHLAQRKAPTTAN